MYRFTDGKTGCLRSNGGLTPLIFTEVGIKISSRIPVISKTTLGDKSLTTGRIYRETFSVTSFGLGNLYFPGEDTTYHLFLT